MIFANTALCIAVCVLALWLLSLRLRDASIVDIFWGPGFGIAAAAAFFTASANAAPGESPGARASLLLFMACAWGLRLGVYLLLRSFGGGEDPRYQAMRRYWGARFPWVSLGTVFLLQGTLMWLVSLPLQIGIGFAGAAALGWLDGLGVALWALGLGFETLGDVQLRRFRADPANAGRVLNSGLWRYTRHPNYFGDACVHWGMGLVALSAAVPWRWLALLGPLLMTFLLLRISGVAKLERSIGRRRPGYADYQARTNAFFPGPPRGGAQ